MMHIGSDVKIEKIEAIKLEMPCSLRIGNETTEYVSKAIIVPHAEDYPVPIKWSKKKK